MDTMERPLTDPLCDSRRFPAHLAELDHLRRTTQAAENRRILHPSADTNGFHPSGMTCTSMFNDKSDKQCNFD